ncbi:MAG: hypothetical protein CL932_02335 [Deltaproteobacteria bacterium]|nr:hypothetical protein [Deltaproteobacteria bacterium]
MHTKRYIAIQTNIPYIPDRTQQGRALCKTSIVVYIGQMVPPLERLERREEPKAKGGEFVEAYVASEDAKNPLKARKQPSLTRIWLAISARKEGMNSWSQGSLRRHKCNVCRNRF